MSSCRWLRPVFARTLGSLLENGIPLITALGIVKNIVGNRIVAEAVENAALNVEKGDGLGKSLEAPNVFPFMVLVVGFIVLSICLPIFEMNQMIG